MAAERARHSDVQGSASDQRASSNNRHIQNGADRVYRLAPDDLEEFISLGEDGQRHLVETPGALDDWLATHSAKYE